MAVAIITGSGTHSLPGWQLGQAEPVATPYGSVDVSRGQLAGVEVMHISRHGAGHVRLSNHVRHRADIWALHALGATAVIGCTACGAVDPSLPLGSLVVFDDLHFISNRLPDGSLCTFFEEPGDPRRGHWILHGGPFSGGVRAALLAGAAASGTRRPRRRASTATSTGPASTRPSEIAQLAACGVTAVSQTGGPETVLCGELELPFALIGFVTDYANEVVPGEPTPVSTLGELMAASPAVFAAVLEVAVSRLDAEPPAAGRAPCSASAPADGGRTRASVLMAAAGGRARRAAASSELAGRARRWADERRPGRRRRRRRRGAGRGRGAAVRRRRRAGVRRLARARPLAVRSRRPRALDDLADDCEISVGPMFDGGFYLVAFAHPVPALLELPDDAWQTRDPIGLAADAAQRSGWAIGLLRTERGLRTPADVSALLADPLVDDELRRASRLASVCRTRSPLGSGVTAARRPLEP